MGELFKTKERAVATSLAALALLACCLVRGSGSKDTIPTPEHAAAPPAAGSVEQVVGGLACIHESSAYSPDHKFSRYDPTYSGTLADLTIRPSDPRAETLHVRYVTDHLEPAGTAAEQDTARRVLAQLGCAAG